MLDLFGPALSSARTLFLFGDAGNGKTAMAEAMSRAMGGAVAVPHAVEVDGQVIVVLDLAWHVPLKESSGPKDGLDQRWVGCQRPFFVIGGELTLEMLEVQHHVNSNVYEAPSHMKANGGMLLVDDFGRQRVSARDMLNRWIVPSRNGSQSAHPRHRPQVRGAHGGTGGLLHQPRPSGAGGRGLPATIKYKVRLGDPDESRFKEILRRRCEALRLVYNETVVDWMVKSHYRPTGRALRASHPRDILQILCDIAAFRGDKATLSPFSSTWPASCTSGRTDPELSG